MAGLATLVIVGLIGAGVYPKEPVRRLAEARLREMVGDEARLGGLRLTPFLLRVEAHDLRLEGPGYELRVPVLRAALSPRALTGVVALRSLELEAPVLLLQPQDPVALDETASDPLPPVEIGAVRVRDATVRWSDPASGALVLEGLAGDGQLGEATLEISVPRVAWLGEDTRELGLASARLAVSPDLDVVLESLEARLGGSGVTLRGPLARRGELALALDYEGELDLQEGGRAFGLPDLSGALAILGHLGGPIDRLEVAFEGRGAVRWGPWAIDDLTLRLEGEPARTKAEVHLDGRVLGGRLEGEARVDGEATEGRLLGRGLDFTGMPPESRPAGAMTGDRLELSWEGPLDGPLQVDLAALGRGAVEGARARLETRARGRVDPGEGVAELEWSAALQGDASTPVALGFRLGAEGRIQGAWPPEVTGHFSGTTALRGGAGIDETILGGNFRTRGPSLQARFDVGGPVELTGELELEGERIEELRLLAERVDLDGLRPGLGGQARLRLEASGPLRSPNISADLSVAGLEWAGVALGALELGAEGTTERADLRVALPNLSIGAVGEMSLVPEPRLLGQVELHEADVGLLASLLGNTEPLSGQLTAGVEFDVPLDRLAAAEATLDVAGLDVSLRDAPLRVLPFRAEVRDGQLAMQDVRVEAAGGFLDLSARAGLKEDDPMELRAWLQADLGVLPLPEGWSASGALSGAVALGGTRAHPVLEGALHAGDVAVAGPSIPEIGIEDVELHMGDSGFRVPSFVARIGSGRATVEGEVPYAAVWPALRRGDLSDADRARLSAFWENVRLGPFEGGLSGELRIVGGLASLEEPEAELRIPALRLAFEGLTLDVLPATLHLAGGRLTTGGLTVRSALGDLVLSGQADLLEETLDARARGAIALGLLSPLVKEASIGGSAAVDLALSGPFSQPVPAGSVTVEGASVRMRALPQAVTGISGRVDVQGATAVLDASGHLGGGSLRLEGEAQGADGGLGDFWLQLTGRDVALLYPPGLRSRLDVELTLAGRPGDLVLAGGVAVKGGVYELDTAAREVIRAPAAVAPVSDFLRTVVLDVTVDLARPIALQSSFGRLEATGRVSARGDLQEPAPFGRLDVSRGGRIDLQGRELTVTGGTIAYSGSWNAELSLNGETVVPNVEFNDRSTRDVRVRASLQGSLEQPSLAFSSEPSLSRQEIVSVIATGRLQSSLVDSSAWLLGGQAATLVSGQLTRRVAQTFRLDEITVRPDLIARETDPSARFTFGKRIGKPLALVYSAGLGGPETRFAEMRVFPGYNVQLRAQRRDAGANELGLGQRFEFGGGAPDQALEGVGGRLTEVRIDGASLQEAVGSSVRLPVGKVVPDWRVQQEAVRLRALLRRRGYLDAEVSAKVEDGVASFSGETGPVYGWRVEGMADPPNLDRTFAGALFEADAVDLGGARLLNALGERGHLRATVGAATESQGDRREIVFTVEAGPRSSPVVVRFPGAEAVSRSVLLEAAGDARGMLEDPEAAVLGVQEAYRARHFLATRVGAPAVERQGSAVTLTMAIQDGPPARLLWIRPEGASLSPGELSEALSVSTGGPFSTAAVTKAVTRLRDLYLSRGYTDVRVRPELVVEGIDLGLVLRVHEGEPRVIETIAVSGHTRTKEWLIRRALDLEAGAPLDPRRLGEAERRLLQLGTFSRSAIVPDANNASVLEVQVREAANLTLAYDARWDDDAGWSGLVDGLAGNVLGLGVGVGGSVRYGGDLREFRGSLHLPAALAAGDVTGSVFRTEEDISVEDLEIQRRQTGFQIQQSIGRPSRLEMLLGYRFRRNLTIAPTLPEIPIDVGGLDVSLLRTTQDDLLDPRRGAFLSFNLNVAPSWLGSDAPLLKGYGQAVFNRSFLGGALTWAQSYRLGLAWGLDGEPVIVNERFRAGGASSLRGFGTNEVGPRGFFGEPVGGEAVVLMNQELRYHHSSGFGLVGFYDTGNVFPTAASMRFDLRHTLGAGLRWASPVGLLRIDLGLPLDTQPDEKGYRVFFGLGQAF